MKKNTLLALSFSLLSLLLLSCTNTTSTQTGSLAGTVQLEGETDHSGIVIGIFELAELDPDIVEANTKWPHIGVKINQHTEFDHRFGTLVKTGETDASGYFEINNIPTGVYNVVAIKDSFGFRYIYNVQINDGENELNSLRTKDQGVKNKEKIKSQNSKKDEIILNPESSKNDFSLSSLLFSLDSESEITLFPATHITSDITSPTTFLSHHHYIIEKDIIIDDELTIEPGAVVRLNEGVKMSIYGDLTAVGQEDNFIWFTSNDSINSKLKIKNLKLRAITDYNRVELDGTLNKQVSYCKFDHAGTGLFSRVNGFEISNCIFRDSQGGFKAENVDSCFCSNLLCEEIDNEQEAGIYFSQVENGCIEKNVVNNCVNGIKIKTYSNPDVKNNYIENCEFGFKVSYYSSPIIQNNEINESNIAVYNYYFSAAEIIYNNIKSNYGIIIDRVNSIISIGKNNFENELYSIQLKPQEVGVDVDAEYNYFGTNNINAIEDKIFDRNDVNEQEQIHYGIIDVIPYLEEPCQNSGINFINQ